MMLPRIAIFFGLFAGLVAPWPGFNGAYGAWMRTLDRAAFSWGHRGLGLRFEALERRPSRPLDTRIVLVDNGVRLPDGNVKATLLDLDMRGIGWVPTAFFTALVLATPVPWKRRARALAWGLIAMHAFVLLSLGVHILRYSGEGAGVFVDGLDETLVNQIGAGFFAAALIWVLVTIRLEDWNGLIGRWPGAQPAISSRGAKSR
jgi:hypothetical protein